MRAVLFDLDGTLSDSYIGISRCIRHAMQEVGQPLDEAADLRWCVGPQLADTFQEMLGGEEALAVEALKHYRERYGTVGMFENELYPGIPAMLQRVRATGARLWVATSKPQVFAKQVIAHFELVDAFDGVYGSELDGTRCDKAELIGHVLEREGIDAAAATMVGDREHDIIGARANGLRSIGVLWGYGSKQELESAGAGEIVVEVAELAAAI